MNKRIKTFYRYFPAAKRDLDWGLYVTTVGVAQFRPGDDYPPSGHTRIYSSAVVGRLLSEYQVVYISAGGGWFKASGTPAQTIQAGQMMLLFPGIRHTYAPSPDTGWNEHWVGFDGNFARQLMCNRSFSRRQPVLCVSNEEQLLSLFNDLIEATNENRAALQQILAGILTKILALLYSDLQSKREGEKQRLKVVQ